MTTEFNRALEIARLLHGHIGDDWKHELRQLLTVDRQVALSRERTWIVSNKPYRDHDKLWKRKWARLYLQQLQEGT